MRTDTPRHPPILIVSHGREIGRFFSGVPNVTFASGFHSAIGLLAVRARAGLPYASAVFDARMYSDARPGKAVRGAPSATERLVAALSPGTEVAHACLPRASGKRGSLPEQGEPETGLADILIVDDERSIRAALAEILGYKGYVSESAADGHEAIGRVMDLKFRGREYRMILMDLKLKPELDGARTARFLDEASPEFRTRSSLSYISAFLSSVDMDRSGTISEKGAFRLAHRFENLRFIRTLNKPVDMEDLLELVSEGIGAYDMASLIKGGGGTVSP